MQKLPKAVLLEAFRRSGEKNYLLSKVFYSALFGSGWKYALLGFSYLKCLDNAVDEDPVADRAWSVLVSQRELIDELYAGTPTERERPIPDRYGYYFFSYDKSHGSPVRPYIESLIETMEFDVRRRGQVLSSAELDGYMLKAGEAVIRFLAHFVSKDLELPRPFVEHASRAYLYADSLIDLEHDLELGIINVSAEDIERYEIDLGGANGGLAQWMETQAQQITTLFDQALSKGRCLDHRTMRLLSQLFLGRKKRELRRFMEREGIGYETELSGSV